MRLLLLVILLSGCGSTTRIDTPNGKGYALDCSELSECYFRAGQQCPKGYTVIDKASRIVSAPYQGNLFLGSRLTLVIECKN